MDWFGSYSIHPRQTPSIQGGRPILSTSVLQGLLSPLDLSQVPATLANLFTLCSYAHRQVSELALESVRTGEQSSLSHAQTEDLRLNVLCDHIRHFATVWYANHKNIKPCNWSACPLLRSQLNFGLDRQALKNWFAEEVLGQDIGFWWRRWQQEGEQWLRQWAEDRQNSCAIICADLLFLDKLARGAKLYSFSQDEHNQALWESWRIDDNFALKPHINHTAYETGVWSRERLYPSLQTSAWTRWCARLLDAVSLLMDDSAQYLQHHIKVFPEGVMVGLEMSRGVLVHFVILDEGKQKIVRYGVLAPTEWNLHPQGRLACALSEERNLGTTQIQALLRAFDPCVIMKGDDVCMK